MFESWTDVVSGVVLTMALAYIGLEIAQRQRKLRDLFEVLDGDDAEITARLERMVEQGLLKPVAGAGAA